MVVDPRGERGIQSGVKVKAESRKLKGENLCQRAKRNVLAFTASVAKFQANLMRLKSRVRQQRQLVARRTLSPQSLRDNSPLKRGAACTEIFYVRSKLQMNYYVHTQSNTR